MNFKNGIDTQGIYTYLTRFSGALFLLVTMWNLYWIMSIGNFNSFAESVFSAVFIIGVVMISISCFLAVINHWNYKSPKLKMWPAQEPVPTVAIIIPTCGEPIDIIMNTVKSITEQNWNRQNRIIVVSDDSHQTRLKSAIKRFKKLNSDFNIIYFTPPRRGHIERRGEAKAGNLNAVFAFVVEKFPYVQYVETRDADDLVGTKNFLSYCVTHLSENPEISFVQTIKESVTSPSDPFSNREGVFYRSTMFSKNAVNAVFPCGSGLVWRVSELKRLGGFPVWNLVEDLQSGFEILKIGGVGSYLPIVGAVAQIAPEDIPNFYKQRGTWALDSMRLFFWKNPLFTKGLNVWQRLQFFELEYSYLLSFSMVIFIVSLFLNLLFNIYPIIDTPLNLFIHFLCFVFSMEMFNNFRSRGLSYNFQNRSRQIWIALMPVFIIACIKAFSNGPHNKPSYKVTRKYHNVAWYWKEVGIHKIIVLMLFFSILCNVFFVYSGINYMNAIPIFWSLFFIYNFSQMIKNSWHGIQVIKKFQSAISSISFGDTTQKILGAVRTAVF